MLLFLLLIIFVIVYCCYCTFAIVFIFVVVVCVDVELNDAVVGTIYYAFLPSCNAVHFKDANALVSVQ